MILNYRISYTVIKFKTRINETLWWQTKAQHPPRPFPLAVYITKGKISTTGCNPVSPGDILFVTLINIPETATIFNRRYQRSLSIEGGGGKSKGNNRLQIHPGMMMQHRLPHR